MDGWTRVGEVLKCASCGAVIERIAGSASADGPEENPSSAGINALSALLGGDADKEKPSVPDDFLEQERRFCRDCAFRVAAAFRMRCARHDRDVNPMDDCPDFTPRAWE